MNILSLRPDGSLGFGNEYGEFRSLDWIKQVELGQQSQHNLYGSGLHKDVSVIFNGVWNPEVDNFNEPVPSGAAYVLPGQLAIDNWPKEARFATMVKIFVKAPGYICFSKRRRKEKRLLSIRPTLMLF